MGYSFKLSNIGKTKMDFSLIVMISSVFVMIICIIVTVILLNKKEPVVVKTVQKQDESKEYVYSIVEEKNQMNEELIDKVPKINLDIIGISDVNKEIVDHYDAVKLKENYRYDYKFNKNDKILSLLIEYEYTPEGFDYPIVFYKTYHIDMDNGSLLKFDELLKKYDVSREELKEFIESEFQQHYKNIVEKGYYTKEECDYNCFMKNRGISTEYLNGVSLYIENEELTLYKYYYTKSDYKEEEYFNNVDYQLIFKKGDTNVSNTK